MSEFQGWIASLSNGEIVLEAAPIPGDFTSWRKLLDRCKNESIKITAMQLVRGNIKVTAIGHKACLGYFQAYEQHMTAFSHLSFVQQGIGSVIGDLVYITWVVISGDPNNPFAQVFQDIRKLDDCKVHTTLQ